MVMGFRRLRGCCLQGPEAVRTLVRAPESGVTSRPPGGGDRRERQVQAAETRLLYENAGTGIVVTILIASLLAYAQWVIISRVVVSLWLLYMLLVICGEIPARAPILACVAERH